MVDSILSLLYDSTVIDKMGDMYTTIYSWSAYALSLVYVLMGFVAFCMLMFGYYDDKRLVCVMRGDEQEFEGFNLSAFRDGLFGCRVDVGASSYWSEIAVLNTLDSLLKLGKISTVQYLERLPDGLITEKEKLIEEIRAYEQAQQGKENFLVEEN